MSEPPPAAASKRPYGALRRPALSAQLLVLALTEYGLFQAYRDHDADFHWATHFLVGLTVAALINLAWLAIKRAPARGVLLSVLAAHLFAMFPDLLFGLGLAHAEWMNVFLGHIWAHYLPGREAGWLAIALLASATYCGGLALWLRAHTVEPQGGQVARADIGTRASRRAQQRPARRSTVPRSATSRAACACLRPWHRTSRATPSDSGAQRSHPAWHLEIARHRQMHAARIVRALRERRKQ